MSSKRLERSYQRTWELRTEIVAIVRPEHRHHYGPDKTGIRKPDLLQVAAAVGLSYDEDSPTLERLYHDISDAVGTEPPSTAGQEWGLPRETLKEILAVIDA